MDYVANFSRYPYLWQQKRRKYKKPQYGFFLQEEQIVTRTPCGGRNRSFTMEFWGEPPEIYEASSSRNQ